jgi:hypothetical protein
MRVSASGPMVSSNAPCVFVTVLFPVSLTTTDTPESGYPWVSLTVPLIVLEDPGASANDDRSIMVIMEIIAFMISKFWFDFNLRMQGIVEFHKILLHFF